MAGPDRGRHGGGAFINQDARMYASVLAPGETRDLPWRPAATPGCTACRATIDVNGVAMHGGDGVAVSDERA